MQDERLDKFYYLIYTKDMRKKNNIATLLFCMFLILGACWVSAKVIESEKIEPIGTWDDTEYETNKQCSFLKGLELEKCKIYFNID